MLSPTTLTITRINDDPAGAGSLTTTSINDNAGATSLFGGLSVADVDTGENDLSLTITLTDPSAGTLSGGGFTETGPGTGIYTVTGLTVTQANTALHNVTFTPTNNTGPSGTLNTDISVTVNDQGGGGEQGVLAATTLTVTRINDDPSGAGSLTTTSLNDNAGATSLFAGLTVGDVDTGENDLSLTITLTDPTAGTLVRRWLHRDRDRAPVSTPLTGTDRNPGQHGTRQRHLHAHQQQRSLGHLQHRHLRHRSTTRAARGEQGVLAAHHRSPSPASTMTRAAPAR